MSYVRFSDEADLYVYDDSDGYTCCCSCRLTPKDVESFLPGVMMYGDTQWPLEDWAAFLAHLDAHKAAGHDVPDWLFAEVRGYAAGAA